jgi:predicted site-specific integrase-resolvase
MTDTSPVEDLVDLATMSDRLGVAAATPYVWRARGLLPPADYIVGDKMLWRWHTIELWARTTDRLPS